MILMRTGKDRSDCSRRRELARSVFVICGGGMNDFPDWPLMTSSDLLAEEDLEGPRSAAHAACPFASYIFLDLLHLAAASDGDRRSRSRRAAVETLNP